MRVRELGLVLALLLICFAVTMREPRFLQGANLEQVALSATLVCIVALGEAVVIIARQVDLSVGAIVATSAFISAEWLQHHPEGWIGFVLLLGCAVGGALGIINALLVTVFRIPAIVATLGTLAIYRGGVIVLAGGRQISATVLPDSYGDIARASPCRRAAARLAGSAFYHWVWIGRALHADRTKFVCAGQQPGERAFRRD